MHAFLVVGKDQKARSAHTHKIIKEQRVVELVTLESEKGIYPIAAVRQARNQLKLKSGGRRAVVVENAQTMTTEAGSAFLKTLEEPQDPTNTIFILTAPREDSVLPTITSRCKVEDLGPVAELAQQIQEQNLESFNKLVSAGVGERLNFIEALESREKATEFVTEQILAARQVLLSKIWGAGNRGQDSQSDQAKTGSNRLYAKFTKLGTGTLVELLESLTQAKRDLESNVNVKLVLANLFLDYPKIPEVQT